MRNNSLGILNIPQIEEVGAMPEYDLVSVDFYPFMSDVSLCEIEDKVARNNDSKKDIQNLINDYKNIKNSVLIPDGRGDLYRWFFRSQEAMIRFLKDKSTTPTNLNK